MSRRTCSLADSPTNFGARYLAWSTPTGPGVRFKVLSASKNLLRKTNSGLVIHNFVSVVQQLQITAKSLAMTLVCWAECLTGKLLSTVGTSLDHRWYLAYPIQTR